MHSPEDLPINPRRGWGERIDHVPLYGPWRSALVASVDHPAVIGRIVEESGFTPRYAFMITMSAGIAVLGLLLSSPAVVIGAMLISPLMAPILAFGFSLTLFDFTEARRSLSALVIGSLIAILFAALIVLVSPLKEATSEILARTRPNLFDLLVAMFAALAGTFAIIRGRGETITGVAIATALMPPLCTAGFGIATRNWRYFFGASYLFTINCVFIAAAAAIVISAFRLPHKKFVESAVERRVKRLLAAIVVVTLLPSLYLAYRLVGDEVFRTRATRGLSDRGSANRRRDAEVELARGSLPGQPAHARGS